MQRIQAPQTLILNLLFLINADALDYTSRPSHYADDLHLDPLIMQMTVRSSALIIQHVTRPMLAQRTQWQCLLPWNARHTTPYHTTQHAMNYLSLSRFQFLNINPRIKRRFVYSLCSFFSRLGFPMISKKAINKQASFKNLYSAIFSCINISTMFIYVLSELCNGLYRYDALCANTVPQSSALRYHSQIAE